MTIYLSVILLVIPSPIFMMISSEAIAILLAMQSRSPVLIALSLAIGQTIGFSLLFFFGDRITSRWTRLNQKLQTFDLEGLRNKGPLFISSASLFGLPPLNLCCIASSAIGLRYRMLCPLIFGGRFGRYVIISSIPHLFQDWFDPQLLPDWLLVDG